MSIRHDGLRKLKSDGYTIKDGEIISPFTGKKLKAKLNSSGYYKITRRLTKNTYATVEVHRYVGYLKFGDIIFNKDLQIRHLDNNSINNVWDNIEIGTKSQNEMDKLPETRLNSALSGSMNIKIHDHKSIIKDRDNGFTYKQIMKKYKISSKGTVSYIINKSHTLKIN